MGWFIDCPNKEPCSLHRLSAEECCLFCFCLITFALFQTFSLPHRGHMHYQATPYATSMAKSFQFNPKDLPHELLLYLCPPSEKHSQALLLFLLSQGRWRCRRTSQEAELARSSLPQRKSNYTANYTAEFASFHLFFVPFSEPACKVHPL